MINFGVFVNTTMGVGYYKKRAKSEEDLVKKMGKQDFNNLIEIVNLDNDEE